MSTIARSPRVAARLRRPVTSAFARVTDKADFEAWLKAARPGSLIEYHRGHLCVDRQQKINAPDTSMRAELHRLATRAIRAAEQSLVRLVQQRHGREDFSYLAIKARPAPPRKRGGRS